MKRVNQKQALFWLSSRDTGMSSECLLMTALGMGSRRDTPNDVYDFGRCVRLLRFVDGVRERLPLMRPLSETWAKLVDAWDELEALYEQDEACGLVERWEGECNARIGEIVFGKRWGRT